ncbi:MAG: methyltransferase domain-containing protein [Marinobacter sp.]|uniref:methyltransferase domain-containing protein n=1 Tax=Marinobacter sp. TaxID=50741 RepID=UPI001B5D9234|nr:methyltransferase domain-containing protein [Marinobacter sp.]MBQ0816162.1 methyltransferase domain-containing protein [Marinobacter sp.]
MSNADTMIWCCPTCHSSLDLVDTDLRCKSCQVRYPVIHDIPDLRVTLECWIDLDEDRERAREAADRVARDGLESAIRHIFRSSRGMDEKKADYRTRQVLAGVEKCQSQCSDWLQPALEANGVILEIGCGPGQLLAAAATRNCEVAGVDVSMEWLVIARHLIEHYGGSPKLAAGFAERLPIADGSVAAIVSLDVIEHVGDQNAYVNELRRVLRPGGFFALSTPNRYSLSPEPHVNVWGVGYLPRSLQARYVKFVRNQSYTFTRLLSVRDTKRLFSGPKGFEARIVFPVIPEQEISNFTTSKKRLALIYNWLVDIPLVKLFLPFFGAYYRVLGNIKN